MKSRNIDEGYTVSIDAYESNNAKNITWINNSVKHFIGIQLAKYETLKEVWDHLQRLFTQLKIFKALSIRKWHMSSLQEEYEYSGVLFCYDKSSGLIGSYKISRIKGMWCLYCSASIGTIFNGTSQWV